VSAALCREKIVLLDLSNVTLCAVSGTLLPQTVAAMERAQAGIAFGAGLFMTDRPGEVAPPEGVEVAEVPSLRSREDYSLAVQTQLALRVRTDFAMVIQWDGYPVRPENWTDAFLDYDYVGAPWPQFPSAIAVGNGGFSLRSRRLLEACLDPSFRPGHPEDVVICHTNRALLEDVYDIRFAPVELARRFSCERMGEATESFGFHGLFNMPREMGVEAFLAFFATLDRQYAGVRELCDLRDVLLCADEPAAREEAGRLLAYLVRYRWRDPAFWRYVRRKLVGGSSVMPFA